MIAYVKKYVICLWYLFIFGICALIGHFQKKSSEEVSISNLKGLATSCVTVLFFTFYTSCFFLCQWAFDSLYRHVRRNEDEDGNSNINERNPIILYSEKGQSVEIEDVDYNFFSKSVYLWYYLYSFGLSVFCVSYCIDLYNLKTAYFFCLGNVIASYLHYFNHEKKKQFSISNQKNGGALLFLFVSMGCFNVFSYTIWMYNYYPFIFSLKVFQWRYVWIENFAPFLAPFFIHSFKNNEKIHGIRIKGNSGSIYVFFSMPLLAFISMLYITLYQSMSEASPFYTAKDDEFDSRDLTKFIVINYIAAPMTVFLSLAMYIGGIRKKEYCLISTSSQSFVYFIFSFVNLPTENVNHNVIIPCCVMTFICFMISVLLLILNVYYKEIALDVEKPKGEEERNISQ